MSLEAENPFRDEGDEFARAQVPHQAALSAPPRLPPAAPVSAQRSSRLEALRAREAELRERQHRLQADRAEVIPSPNFPPWAPMVIFDPARDIPEDAWACVTTSLYGLIAAVASVCLNIIAVLCVRGLGRGFNHVWSLIFAFIQGFGTAYVILTYSFSRLYAACHKRDIPFSWIVSQFLIVGWTGYLAIGFPDSGCVGIATFLDLLAKSPSRFSIFVAALNTALVIAVVSLQFATLYRAQAYQKVSGRTDATLVNRSAIYLVL
jgi:hypothetical protein